jgi:parallel beta-helix repeat protein
MDLAPEGGPVGSAGIGVEIGPGVERCRFRGLRISGAGAAGIHGAQVAGCTVEGSLIQDSGDDGIFLRGSDFVILGNTIARYFDEAVDVAGSGEFVVADNQAQGGRIGIVLGGGSTIEVSGNVVSNNLQGSIHVHEGTGKVAVDSNRVSPAGGTAIIVSGAPDLSMVGNRAGGGAEVGFLVEAVAGGILEGNVASVGGIGYQIGEVGDAEIRGNSACASARAGPIELVGNGTGDETPIVELPAADPRCAEVELPPSALPALVVEGDSAQARAMADSLSNYLRWVNPGYLSVGLSGDSVWTEIDRDLRDVLLATRGNSIGILRTAFLYGIRSGHPGMPFPRWHLFHDEELVAVVVPRIGGASMVARFGDGDGEIVFRDRVGLWRWMGDHHVRRFWEAVPPFWSPSFWRAD